MPSAILGTRDVSPSSASLEEPYYTALLSWDQAFWTEYVDVLDRGLRIGVQGTGKRPEWLRSVLEAVARILSLQPGWDSYGAAAISPVTASEALRLLLDLAGEQDFDAPAVVPTPKGGVQIEWSGPDRLIELELSPGAAPALLVHNVRSGSFYEEALVGSLAPLRRALARE
jgi:hypothetical protein